MRPGFVLGEVGAGLRRNLVMTVAVVLTTAVSLGLLGLGLLLRAQVETMKDYWYDRVEVSVFLCGELDDVPTCAGRAVTDAEREQLRRDLEAVPQVERVFYESSADAYARFTEQFADSPDLVANVSPDALPESFRVKLTDPTQFDVVAAQFRDRPGVESVQDQKRLLDRFFTVLGVFRNAALFVAGLQLLAAALLISNTIRVAAFSRRRETGIMRLVGASSFSIQLPFLLEGALAGLAGSLLAVGFVAGVKAFFVDEVLRPVFTLTSFVGWDAVLALVPVIVGTGVLLSVLASFLTLRRHLRV